MLFRCLFLLLCSVTVGFSQTVGTSVSKKEIKIGQQIQLTLQTKVNEKDLVVFPDLDSIGKLEVVEAFPVEKIKKGQQVEWRKKYNLTQFNPGKYKIPSLEVVVNKKKINSESIEISVVDVIVDTTKQKMYDIKEDEVINLEKTEQKPELSDKEVILGLLFALVFASIFYLILKLKHRNKKKSETYITPYNKAFLTFSDIKSTSNAKEYYSSLTQIIKSYFEKTLEFSALESTTEQFIFKLKTAVAEKQFEISETTISQIEKLFTKADLVKFAKISVAEEEQNADKLVSENIINVFHKTLPTSAEEQRFAFAKLMEAEKQQKQKNTRQSVFIITFLVFIVSIVFFFGWENVTNYINAKINGKDAEYYLRKEWLVSEYGLPILQLESPEILVRDSIESKNPNVKNISQFSWQNVSDKLSISIQTVAYKDSLQPDLKVFFDAELDNLMQLQAKNIKTTARKFKNVKNLSGDILEGSYDINEGSEIKSMRFLTVFLSDSYGLQKIRITHDAKDKNAKSFIERVTNSLEQLNQEEDE
ncbi:BatD family protein [Flavobacterium difficile]|uniref:Protein BatD n=1 Tax=Flavobacterium difficile TaxID=2709659 RepID=A0ABX0IAS1_9FLAO|nr:BatD family protein [Flavobacterium difficile]NHM02787.1 protein BatD [Flavobacterium difficile]